MSSLEREVLRKGLPPSGMMHLPSSARKLPASREFSPLPWTDFFDEKRSVELDGNVFNVYLSGKEGPLFYLLHGGGYSGLTWACFAKEISTRIDCRIVAPDLRGHGQTHTTDDADLSSERQVKDIIDVFNALFENEEPPPKVFVVGHSMGGALAVRAVAAGLPHVVAVAVIDVVEGSAMDALSMMVHFLEGRPQTFESEEEAVRWCLQTGTAKNYKAARISMPAQLKKSGEKFTWRIDLTRTQDHWVGWFKGLSSLFLSLGPPKLLVLAGPDRLDKELTIGQMQGKFQTSMLPKVGHAVQEDSPDRLADEFARFCARYRFAELKRPLAAERFLASC